MNHAHTSRRSNHSGVLNTCQVKDLSRSSPVFVTPKPTRGHVVKNIQQFGNFSPNWTIGSSRRPPRPPDQTPSPGDYEVERKGFEKFKYNGIVMSPRRVISDRTVTSDIDMTPSIRLYPQIKESHIGSRSDTYFYDPTSSPPVIYDQKSTLSPRSHKINEKVPEKPNTNPGPGEYTPNYEKPPKMATIPKFKPDDLYKAPEPDNPGPGSYDIERPLRPPKRWFVRRRITAPQDD